ncbi:hypothetical protein EsVE80_15460 [Enterococcus saigonensis]|uniref:Uncharacterized protein n=1 Tax=Enterococcus saigonensis TaxID=1805431 RepID=A0A679ICR3_9ENTE|nr:hypothetical protein [Enterococcus saigonensis]BCA86023.1 hypothetical protein EsVE80_15460 [Enterococcus saigonensis]
MGKYTDINRKHYRFPAYDDKENVKIQKEKRNLFAKDRSWLLTDEPEDKGTSFYTPPKKNVLKNNHMQEERALRRSRKATAAKQGHTLAQQEELKKHRENLPDYSKKVKPETDLAGRTSLFGKDYKRSTYKVKNKPKITPEENTMKRYSAGRTYFVPKYIPASLIPEKKKNVVDETELMDSLHKNKEQYLLFDHEPAAFQEKKADDPAVEKFYHEKNVPAELADSKIEIKPEKKSKVLERDLKGLIEEGQSESRRGSGYFEE